VYCTVCVQAVQSFSSALSSGQLGPLMRQFGLSDDTISAAAASGGQYDVVNNCSVMHCINTYHSKITGSSCWHI